MRRPAGHRRRWLAALAWAIAGAVAAAPASAGSFKINPVQVTLSADAKAASLTITNSDSAAVSVRASALAWTQADGADVYSPTANVIISPPIFTIAAGKTQLVRIGLKARGGAPAYRLIFEEIPRGRPAEGQIQVNLRLNLPLYLLPTGGGQADLQWHVSADRSGVLTIEGRNPGTRHRQVTAISAAQGGKAEPLSQQVGVVLPAGARQWKVGRHPALDLARPLELIVRTQSGETRARVVVEQR